MSLVLALQSLFVRIGDRIPIVLRCGMKSASAHFVKNVFVVQDIDYQTCESVMVETWNGNIRAIVYLPVYDPPPVRNRSIPKGLTSCLFRYCRMPRWRTEDSTVAPDERIAAMSI